MDFNHTQLNRFFSEVKKIKPLTNEEQIELLKQYKINPTSTLREKLINNNLRLLLKVVLDKPASEQNTIEDKIGIASIGLVKAIDDYNPDLGFTFATFARRYIDTELINDYHINGNTIKQISHVKQKIKDGKVQAITMVSGSTTMGGDDNSTELQDTLISDTYNNQFDLDNNTDHQSKLDQFWLDIKAVLKPNQYDVIKAHYSDNVVVQGVKSKRMTDMAIAEVLGTTKQNVGQIRMYALKRIQRSGILEKYKGNIDFFRF